MKLVYRWPGRRAPESLDVWIGPALCVFRPTPVGFDTLLVADLADDLYTDEVKQRIHALAGLVYELEPASVLAVAPPVQAVVAPAGGDPAPVMPPPVAAAFRNGWRMADLTGLGSRRAPDGTEVEDYGPGGGFSAVSGLTVAQMAVSAAPPRWDELDERFWPWEIDGWVPPLDFVPPGVPKKAGAPVDEPLVPPAPVVPPDVGAGEVKNDTVIEPAPTAPVDPTALDGWSSEDIAAARATLADVDAQAGGEAPLQRASFHVGRAIDKRHKVGAAQLAALRG